MMATPSPVKLKAYLGEFKDTILDGGIQSIQVCLRGLLAAELVQRGVHLSVPGEILNADRKILEAVHSTAGRPLLDANSGNIPKPLLAAVSAVAGMMCEQCVSLLSISKQNLDAGHDLATMNGALRRCQEVQDVRFSCLLNVYELVCTNGAMEEQAKIERIRTKLLWMAQGFYMRAATFQPDPPQMWKKSLDAVAARNQDSATEAREASLPLQRLIDIAQKKGNDKRVSELSIRLAESYLSDTEALDDELNITVKAFVAPYQSEAIREFSDRVSIARRALGQCSLDRIGQQDAGIVLRHKLLQLRIELTHEDDLVEHATLEIQASAKNRGISLSLEDAELKARSKVWRGMMENNAVDTTAMSLLDWILSTDHVAEPSPYVSSAMLLVSKQAQRLVERSRTLVVSVSAPNPALSKTESDLMWHTVAVFVWPFLSSLRDRLAMSDLKSSRERENWGIVYLESLTASTVEFIESCLKSLSRYLWMTCASFSSDPWHAPDNLQFVSDMLQSLLLLKSKGAKVSQRVGVVQSAHDKTSSSLHELECAHASVRCLASLSNAPESFDASEQESAAKAISMSEEPQRFMSFQAEYGTWYLQFLVCWSGLFRSPWPVCNISQARAILRHARHALKLAFAEWGREACELEEVLLDIGDADAEGGFLGGGLQRVAREKYRSSILSIDRGVAESNPCLTSLIRAHCLCGLARIGAQRKCDEECDDTETGLLAEISGSALAEAERAAELAVGTIAFVWRSVSGLEKAAKYHVSAARRQLADSLVRSGRPVEAQDLFESAVQDDPLDFDAALALGAFRLRMALYDNSNGETSSEIQRLAQIQLLKAAKLNSQKPDTFALLGVWYETKGDKKRAIGCFSKALLLSPTNPVAGRGILRLKELSEVKGLCEAATNVSSQSNGWAWRALGQAKAMVDGSDNLATICFHKALRCRDIEAPTIEPFATFFHTPFIKKSTENENSNVWVELAQSYRRLGRYSAAIRAFDSAWLLVGTNLASVALCSWAQVELEVGLFEAAIEKFGLVVRRGDMSRCAAAHGQATAFLLAAQRDLQDGKCGSAFALLRQGIDGIKDSMLDGGDSGVSSPFRCATKTLGDLYSLGAILPPDVFFDGDSAVDEDFKAPRDYLLRTQLAFVALGEQSYLATERYKADDETTVVSRAAFLCDIGSNLLFQAQLLGYLHGPYEGGDASMQTIVGEIVEVRDCYRRSADFFERALEEDPTFGPAWCGYGCAVSGSDSLLAQHAFSTSVMVDKTLADAWANLGFLYAHHDEFGRSGEVLDSLTQAADSPMMWIGRAIMLEAESFGATESTNVMETMSRAADAYRAALQVKKHPSAVLGLSLTCRASIASNLPDDRTRLESQGYMTEYLASTASTNSAASLLGAVMLVEDGVAIASSSDRNVEWTDEIVEEGARQIRSHGKLLGSDMADEQGVDIAMIAALPKCVASFSAKGEGAKDDSPAPGFSLARQIFQDPESSQAWLKLAKSLASDAMALSLPLDSSSSSSSSSFMKRQKAQVLQNAILAADRAAWLLERQASHPIHVMSPSVVSRLAEDVSEALALAHWLRLGEPHDNRTGDEDPSESTRNVAVSLQRAFFLCPDNPFAREALMRQHIEFQAEAVSVPS